MKNVEIASDLPVSVERLWDEITKPSLLVHTARGMIKIVPHDPPVFPERWDIREYEVRLKFWGILPIDRQIIGIEYPRSAPHKRELRDRGRSTLIRVWDHRITLDPIPKGPDTSTGYRLMRV